MKNLILYKNWIATVLVSIFLISCGGSGDPSNGGATSTITGTAATGAAIASKQVTAVDANGVATTTMTGSDGKFTITVDASAQPFMLKVEINGETLFSFAENGGEVANITPMTNLALMEMNKNAGNYLPLDNLFSAFKDHQAQVLTAGKIKNAKGVVNALFNTQLTANGVDTKIDFFKTVFEANKTKIDKVLDSLDIVIDPSIKSGSITISGITINIKNPETGAVLSSSGYVFPTNYAQFIPSGESNTGSTGSLADSIKGQIVDMKFASAQAGAPYSNDDVVKFTFSSSGYLMLTENYTVFSQTVIKKSETLYEWDNGTYKYELSLLNNAIHEVNVSTSAGAFLGQFTPSVAPTGFKLQILGTIAGAPVDLTLNGPFPEPTEASVKTVLQGNAPGYGAPNTITVTKITDTENQKKFTISAFVVNSVTYTLDYRYFK
ncbi:MAG: hypothetical protein ISR69_00080 [Gammaproteobacteria bacterium]|nr:hypothetical protein [Gammaproteobacteria bacterium]